jgi:hypothetical protein
VGASVDGRVGASVDGRMHPRMHPSVVEGRRPSVGVDPWVDPLEGGSVEGWEWQGQWKEGQWKVSSSHKFDVLYFSMLYSAIT